FYAGMVAIIGVSAAHHLRGAPWLWIWIAIALSAALAAIWLAPRVGWIFLAVLAGFAALHEGREFHVDQVSALWGEEEFVAAEIEGVVIASPRAPRRGNRWGLTIQLERIKTRDLVVETQNRIHLFTNGSFARQGDRIIAEGILTPLPEPRNPAEFSRRDYARDSEGVVAELNIASRYDFHVVGKHWFHQIFDHATRARIHVGRAITRGLDPRSEQAQILKAMVLGARDEADPEVEEPFRLSGALHIFAVSGLHVGIFGTVIWFLLRAVYVPRRAAIAVIIVAVLTYAFITGLRPSAVRAAIMTSVFLGGFVLRRRSRLLNSLGFAAICILAIDSRQLFSVGFQLSFSVLTSISLLTPFFSRLSANWLNPDPFIPNSLIGKGQRLAVRGGRRICDVFWVSLTASLGSAGLIWWYFGLLTPIAVLANCALVPIAWCVICLATVSFVFSPWPWVSGISVWLNQLNSYLVICLHNIAGMFAQVPNGHMEVTPLSDHFVGEPGQPGMVVFDTSRSCGPQVVHLKDSDGGRTRTWLIDSGDETRYGRIIRPWLRENKVDRLDGFFATHGDIDHIGGAPSLVHDFRPLQLVQTQMRSTSKALKELEAYKQQNDVSALQLTAGAKIELGDEATLEVIFPPPNYPDQSAGDDECLICLVEWRGFRFLNMGDSGFRTEKWLLANAPPESLRADVLIKSQHSADFSGLSEFILAVAPKAVIATNDSFPANEAISNAWRELLKTKLNISLFDQAESGAVLIDVHEDQLKLEGFVNGQTIEIKR
ncbi:MAG: ComEC/Rec2 family competence protein, partial [Verrucomicrobiota bacterium]